MNAQKAVVVLSVICLLSIAGLLARHVYASRLEAQARAQLETLQQQQEQQHAESVLRLSAQEQTNAVLQGRLESATSDLASLTQRFTQVTQQLESLRSEVNLAAAATQAAQAQIADRDKKIDSLESDRAGLTKRMSDLNTSLEALESKISETERRLASAEGDRAFLLKELKRLQAEKAGLERQFNDLAVLRAQVRKLRAELSISRRIEWIQKGLFGRATGKKGAELLKSGFQEPVTRTNYNLNVELNQKGAVRVIPPNPEPKQP